MSHEVESMMYVGKTPWHSLGVPLECPPTAQEAMVAAGLNWRVEKRQVYQQVPRELEGDTIAVFDPVPDHYAVTRMDNDRALSVVGASWNPLQNEEAFRFFDPFIEAGSAEYHTAGSLKGGQRVWVLAKVTGGLVEVAKNDPVESYLLLSNSHDGRYAVNVRFTPVRVVCWNTLTMAEGNDAAPHLRVYHRGNVTETMAKVQEVTDLTRRTFAATFEQYQFLAARQVQNIEKFIVSALGKDDQVAAKGRLPYATDKIISLFESGQGQSNPAIRGSLWAAYNAVTEFVDHQRGTDEARLDQAWFGEGRRIKQRALQVATQLARAA